MWVAGTAVQNMSEGQIAVWRGRNVGVVFQFFQLLPTLTVVGERHAADGLWRPVRTRERRERALHLLSQVDMADQADKLPTCYLRRPAAACCDRAFAGQ